MLDPTRVHFFLDSVSDSIFNCDILKLQTRVFITLFVFFFLVFLSRSVAVTSLCSLVFLIDENPIGQSETSSGSFPVGQVCSSGV